jgi:drug/metabolite transporter (DMT)-like permease
MIGTVTSVSAAVAAASAFGVSAVLQHRQARATAGDRTRWYRLLDHLARRPWWLAGILLAVAAYALAALALAFGPLTLVAPIVAMDLLFAVPLSAWWSRRPMSGRDWTGCALVVIGVGLFLATSPPSSGRSDAPALDWVLAFGAVALVCAAAVAAGHRRQSATRARLLAAAAGVTFGLTAAVTLSASRLFRDVPAAQFPGHWQPWALMTLGLTGLLLAQTAFQAAPLTASLPVIATLEPISGVVIGTVVFHERLAASAFMLAVQLCAAAVAVAGIVLLASSALVPDGDAGRGDRRADPAGPGRSRARPQDPGWHTGVPG